MFHSLQACRAAAAIMVVIFHVCGTFAQAKYFGWDGMGRWFGWGDAGVDFFFVLSGFLIVNVHHHDIGRPHRLKRYLLKRAIRIYPTYWIVCAGVCAAALVVPALRYALPSDAWTYVGALSLLPLDRDVVGGTGSPILFVAWSLQYELLFYGVMAAFIVARPLGIAAALAIVAAHFACVMAPHCAFPASFVKSNMIFLFAMGAAASYVVRSRFQLPWPQWMAAAAALGFVGFGLFEVQVGEDALGFDRRPVFGALATLLIVALVQAESRGLLSMRSRGIALLGESSYALYLLHIPIISVLVKVLTRLNPGGTLALVSLFWLTVIACIGMSALFYQWVERPMLARLNRRALGPGEHRSPVLR